MPDGNVHFRYLRYATKFNPDEVKSLCQQTVLQQGVELTYKPVDAFDDKIYRSLQDADDCIPNATENFFDASPCFSPIRCKYAGQEINKAPENLFYTIYTNVDIGFCQFNDFVEPPVCFFVKPVQQTCQPKFEPIKNAKHKSINAGKHLDNRLFHFL